MTSEPANNPKPQPKRSFQPPKGTRDFYPQEMLRRRYITDAWRRVSLRHGFDEIDGPTFEHAELYTVKSGEGILSELFSFKREGGDDLYALRPEFTPTLARMYAARARQLPQPTKWFCIPSFFRAERPQRGRLREFFQWNCDLIGEGAEQGDAEIASVTTLLLQDLGLTSRECEFRFNSRPYLNQVLESIGVAPVLADLTLQLLDRAQKLAPADRQSRAEQLGLKSTFWEDFAKATQTGNSPLDTNTTSQRQVGQYLAGLDDIRRIYELAVEMRLDDWFKFDRSIVRGLAYYTGMVFEVIAEGERAVAGGGRYDNLIELFGGPPTPACGFGMGDVVLGNLLDDKKLIPEGADMLRALSRPMPLRPAAFIIANESEAAQGQLVPTVARLRRGVESEKHAQGETKPWDPARYAVPPMHARRTYKATKNIGKLLQDAAASHARFAVIIESAETCTLKDLDTREEIKNVALSSLGAEIARRAPDVVG